MKRNEERSGRMQQKCMDKTQPVEHTVQLTLPDYRSEISRLLWVRPTLMPPTRFVGGGKIDLSGPVRYSILYVGANGALCNVECEEGYAFSLPVDLSEGFDAAEGLEITAEPVIDTVISRVTGPRKLSVRCRAHVRVLAYAETDLSPRIMPDGEGVHRLSDVVDCARMLSGIGEHFEVSDSVEVEAGEGELRLISASGSVLLSEAGAQADAALCRGELLLTLLLCRESASDAAGKPFVITHRVPFEREVAMTGATPDLALCASGTVGEVACELEGDHIQLRADVALSLEGQCEEAVVVCRDAFGVGSVAECRFEEETVLRAGCCANRNFTVSEERPLAEVGVLPNAKPLFAVADAALTERRTEGERTTLLGELHCHVLYEREGEYGVADVTLPYRTHLAERADDVVCSCQAPVCRVSAGREGESWRIDAEVQLALRAVSTQRVTRLREATLTPRPEMSRSDIEICYLAAGESLWDVSKRYAISPEELAGANGVPSDDLGNPALLQSSKYLIIP